MCPSWEWICCCSSGLAGFFYHFSFFYHRQNLEISSLLKKDSTFLLIKSLSNELEKELLKLMPNSSLNWCDKPAGVSVPFSFSLTFLLDFGVKEFHNNLDTCGLVFNFLCTTFFSFCPSPSISNVSPCLCKSYFCNFWH